MKSIIKLAKGIAAVSLLAIAGAASATPIAGSTTGTFDNAMGGSGMVTSGEGTSFFTWGRGTPSSLSFLGAGFAGTVGDYFDVGTLIFSNGAIFANTGADSVDLSIGIDFTAPSGISESFTFMMNLINTPNVGSPEDQADTVSFNSLMSSERFNIGAQAFILELEVGQAGEAGFTSIDSFSVFEGASESATIRGRLTAVPAPAGFALLLAGLAGLLVSRRR
ncbi:MAG: choice-of-anchor K domain-containing protein [Pseudomonadota bacterium]